MTVQIPTRLDAQDFAVRTSGLTKAFGKHVALDTVDITVPLNSFYVLVGPNGAGKTTLLKLLLELITPTYGTMDVLGMNPVEDGARVRAHVGYVSERSDDLYAWMTATEALRFHRRYFPAWDNQYANELVDRLGIKDGKLSRLSKGEVRRVQIVMALAHRPPLLLLDEPTDGLDPLGREIFRSVLAEHIATSPTTVVVSTHLVFEIEGLADHLAVLRDGHLVAQVSTDQLHRNLKRYVVNAGAGAAVSVSDAAVKLNGDSREAAWTLWGDEAELAQRITTSGANIREVRALTLQEAAVAFLSEPQS